MKRTVSILAGGAALALANVAVAEEAQVATADEPITLTDLQLDQVSAAGNRLEIDVVGDNITNGSFSFNNLPGVFSFASLSYTQTNFGGIVITSVVLESDTND